MAHYRVALVALVALLPGCAPVMEAMRPDPVDLSQFVPGESHTQVIAAVGAPVTTVADKGHSCDVYKLYTRGLNGIGKGAIAAGEAAADVLTLGLSEVLFTPAEAATTNAKHTVLFCYDNDKLLSVNEFAATLSE